MDEGLSAPGIGNEEVAHSGESRAVEPRARERWGVAALSAFGVREVDRPVLREEGMEGEVLGQASACGGRAVTMVTFT